MKDDSLDVEQRVKRYWYTDGIGELVGGGMFLLLGGYFALQQYFRDGSLAGVILRSGLVLFLIVAMFLGRRLIQAVKARVTYPRTGYVEYQAVEKNKFWPRFLTMIVAMAAAMLVVAASRSTEALDAVVAVSGALVALILLIKQGWSASVPRFYLLSGIALFLGLALAFSGLPSGYNLALFYGLMGLTFAVSGGLTLRQYLHENPLPADTEPQNG